MFDPGKLLERQRRHFDSGATRSLEARREAIAWLLALIDRHEDEFLEALHRDLGKGRVEAFSSELQMVRGECRHALKHLRGWMKPERRRVPVIAWPGRAKVWWEPCEAVLILGPWNYPVHLLLTPLVGALAAGNVVVLKPSEMAPAVAEVIARRLGETFDPAALAVVTGGPETAEVLLEQRFDHIFFTGSTATGRKVMAAATKFLTPVTLELGGKCPVLVFGGRESGSLKEGIDVVARRIAWGKHLNAGQTCVAPDHVLVSRELHDPLVEALGKAFGEFRGGEYSRIVNRRHFERLRGLMGDGRVAFGGEVDKERLSIEPTLLTGVAADSAVMREEIFGPLLPVISCDSLDEALRDVHSRPDPLAVYLFTRDDKVIEKVVENLRSGGVCVNDTVVQICGPELPFGGVGDSGMGRYRGRAGFDTFSRERVVLKRGLAPDFRFRYPPAKLSLEKMRKLPRFLSGG